MSKILKAEQLVAELKAARERGDQTIVDHLTRELDHIAKHDQRLVGTITAMLATL